ncbi:MAG: hypothetical protein KDB80_04910 [Planctomycetes bacterium]|nr:hypothetical protein [Planctomycetota bacterium]
MRGVWAAVSFSLACHAAVHAQTFGTFEATGGGCPNPRVGVVYETFASGAFDLDGASAMFVPAAEGTYSVVPGPPAVPYGAANGGSPTGSLDDTIRGPFALGFSFPFGGASVDAVDVDSNGFLYLEPGSVGMTRCCDLGGTFRRFLLESPSIAALGTDLDPTTGDVWFESDTNFAAFTWDAVSAGGAPARVQIQLYSTGGFAICWIECPLPYGEVLVGYSEGAGVVDLGPVDLTADLPIFSYAPFGQPLSISSVDAPTIGTTMTMDVTGIPASATFGAMLFGTAATELDLAVIGAAGCHLLTNATLGSVPFAILGSSSTIGLPIVHSDALVGLTVEAQAAVLAPGSTPLGLVTSNRGTLSVGDATRVLVESVGLDSFNHDTSAGFWRVTNGPGNPNIVGLRFDWLASGMPILPVFDTDQREMGGRFDGGNSLLPSCSHTYRNGSEVVTGLVYPGTMTSPCDAAATTGWIGTNPGPSLGDFRTLDFLFTGFEAGETFEMDIDTDGGGNSGGAMAGLVITVTFADGSSRTGSLAVDSTYRAVAEL